MTKKMNEKNLKIRAVMVFIVTFLIFTGCVCLIFKTQEQSARLHAVYTAETTIGKIESMMNKYLAKSDLMRNIVEAGYKMDNARFSHLAELLQDDDSVIQAYELAENGIVSQIYPVEQNEEAMGLNLLAAPERRREAQLAMNTGQYTIAGPFELTQGGTGALLFNPVFVNTDGEEKFWGFSLLVINWEAFMDEVELDRLENASYSYQFWKSDSSSGQKTIIAGSSSPVSASFQEVPCPLPGGTWYFDISPVNGWIPGYQIFIAVTLVLLLSALITAGYWQFLMQRCKDALYEEKIEKSAREARLANEAKTRFLFNMSHDIRTPMNAIIGFTGLLEKHLDDKEILVDYIRKIQSSSSFLLSLINHVLEMARIESGKAVLQAEVLDINELLKSLNSVFEPDVRKKKLHYICAMDIRRPYIVCDKTKLHEILLNIISNSIKYTPEGGSIKASVTELSSESDSLVSYCFKISDNGIGMSEEYLPHIFEEFTREHTSTESQVDGTGLGLSIVKSLVELMKGTIEVKSQPGSGTTFIINLSFPPASPEQIKHCGRPANPHPAVKLSGKRILLAEDNALNAEIVSTILQENDFQVQWVKDGAECVAAIEKMPVHFYDAVLMDIQMPKMDGYEATKAIRSMKDSRASIPIIAMTANAFDEDRQKALAAGMNAHIAKPLDTARLFETLEQLLRDI